MRVAWAALVVMFGVALPLSGALAENPEMSPGEYYVDHLPEGWYVQGGRAHEGTVVPELFGPLKDAFECSQVRDADRLKASIEKELNPEAYLYEFWCVYLQPRYQLLDDVIGSISDFVYTSDQCVEAVRIYYAKDPHVRCSRIELPEQ